MWTGCKAIWQNVWNYIRVGWLWVVGTIVGFIAISEHVTAWVLTGVMRLSESIGRLSVDGLDPGSHVATSLSSLFVIANTFFPVTELFTLLSALSLVALSAAIYTFLKSWVPTWI